MKRLLAVLLLFVSFASPAFAAGWGWVDVTAWLSDLAFVRKAYMRVPATTTQKKDISVLLPFQELTQDEIRLALAEHGKLPASNATPELGGIYRYTFGNYNFTKTYQATGNTIGEFKASMAMCPSDVCTSTVVQGGGTFYGSSSDLNIGAFARNMSAVNVTPSNNFYSGKHYLQLRLDFGGYTAFLNAYPGSVTCPAGYTLNATTGKCDLTSVSDAAFSVGDGVCISYAGVPAYGDPDCNTLKADNKLTTSTSTSGRPAVSVSANTGTVVTQTVNEDFSSTVSKLVQTSDGGAQRQDTNIASDGTIGPTNITNFPKNPPPLYPGDPGGTAVPGASTGTGTTAVPCGGPSQPKCQVDVSGVSDLVTRADWTNNQLGTINQSLRTINDTLNKNGTGGTSPVDKVGDTVPESVRDSVSGLKARAVIPVSDACPADMFSFTLPFPASMGGDYVLSDDGVFCNLMSRYQSVIRGLSIAAGFIAAMFIVLGA